MNCSMMHGSTNNNRISSVQTCFSCVKKNEMACNMETFLVFPRNVVGITGELWTCGVAYPYVTCIDVSLQRQHLVCCGHVIIP